MKITIASTNKRKGWNCVSYNYFVRSIFCLQERNTKYFFSFFVKYRTGNWIIIIVYEVLFFYDFFFFYQFQLENNEWWSYYCLYNRKVIHTSLTILDNRCTKMCRDGSVPASVCDDLRNKDTAGARRCAHIF